MVRALSLALLVGLPSSAWAARVEAASCSRADVGAAVAQAASGDEVFIPAGTCAWQTMLVLTRTVTLRGAGRALTIIRDDVPKDGSSVSNLIDVEDVNGLEITELTVEGLAVDGNVYNKGHLFIGGTSRDFRVHHVTFRDLQTSGVFVGGSATGLVDNCSFSSDFKQGVAVAHDSWDGGGYGDSSWATPATLGTRDAVYVEDCTFNNVAAAAVGAVSSFSGARVVMRHCTVQDDAFYASGTDSSGRFRGTRHVEVYANRFVVTRPQWTAISIGSGTGAVYDNVLEGDFSHSVRLEVLRTINANVEFGRCNGSNVYDQNSQPSGYACLDSVGRGEGALLSDYSPPLPQAWPQQVLDPLYVWNTVNDAGVPMVTNVTPTVLAAGRDYLEGVARPGYAAFTYPHPLRAVDSADGGVTVADAGAAGRYWRVVGCSSAPGELVMLGVVLWWRGRRGAGRVPPERISAALGR